MKFLKELYDEFPEKEPEFPESEESGQDLSLDSDDTSGTSEEDEFNFDVDTQLVGKTDDDLTFPEDEEESEPMDPATQEEPTEPKGKYDEFLNILIKFIEYYQNKDKGAEFPDIEYDETKDLASDNDDMDDIAADSDAPPEDMSMLPADSEQSPEMGDDSGLNFDDVPSNDEPADEFEDENPNDEDLMGPEEEEEEEEASPSRYPF